MKLFKAFRESTIHTKIFFLTTFGIGLLTLVYCLYPYFWLDANRTPQERTHVKRP